jgi:hypothetical protein
MGSDCNKLAGKKCWNPVDGAATTATCENNDYQCKVRKIKCLIARLENNFFD